jgi:hypothetical protein
MAPAGTGVIAARTGARAERRYRYAVTPPPISATAVSASAASARVARPSRVAVSQRSGSRSQRW